ncbi:MAG: hypothetical protein HeimC3_41270 [Candidatus Heimdallarchaeota archaeon LC_3]|nr:MAG: hypothetical protein HeimC3_41270 [Candidatus Heimdallarchaeota archaeon LC_3]
MNIARSDHYNQEFFSTFCYNIITKRNTRSKFPYTEKFSNEVFIGLFINDLGYFLKSNFSDFFNRYDKSGAIFQKTLDILLTRKTRIKNDSIIYEFIAIFDVILFLKKERITGFVFFALLYRNLKKEYINYIPTRRGMQQGRAYYEILKNTIKSLVMGTFKHNYSNYQELELHYNQLFSIYVSTRDIKLPAKLPYDRLSDYHLVTQFNKFIEYIFIKEINNDLDNIADYLEKEHDLWEITSYFPILKDSILKTIQSESAQCLYTPLEFASSLLFFLNKEFFLLISSKIPEYSLISRPRLWNIVTRKKKYLNKMFDSIEKNSIQNINSYVLRKLKLQIDIKKMLTTKNDYSLQIDKISNNDKDLNHLKKIEKIQIKMISIEMDLKKNKELLLDVENEEIIIKGKITKIKADFGKFHEKTKISII